LGRLNLAAADHSSAEYQAFELEIPYKNEPVVTQFTLPQFLCHNDYVATCNIIKLWLQNFHETGSSLKNSLHVT
jgi:hypothetical protein